jgi:hypothetical protein
MSNQTPPQTPPDVLDVVADLLDEAELDGILGRPRGDSHAAPGPAQPRQVAMPMQKEGPLRTPLVAVLRDDKFRNGLLKWTLRRVGHQEDAEDVLGAAMEAAVRHERRGIPWDPNGKVTAGLHMIRHVQHAISDRKKYRSRNRADLVEDIERAPSEDTSPGDRVRNRLEANERRRLANELHRELVATGKDPVVVEILESISRGAASHGDIARQTRRPLGEVIAGIKRLTRYAKSSIDTFRQQARFQ